MDCHIVTSAPTKHASDIGWSVILISGSHFPIGVVSYANFVRINIGIGDGGKHCFPFKMSTFSAICCDYRNTICFESESR